MNRHTQQALLALLPLLLAACHTLPGERAVLIPRESEDHHYGYVDAADRYVIAPQFDNALDFSHGLARVSIDLPDSYRWGLIDSAGHFIVEPRYHQIGDFVDGLARVLLDGEEPLWGYIDTLGHEVIAPQYTYAEDFADGHAQVLLGDPDTAQWHTIDTQGHRLGL